MKTPSTSQNTNRDMTQCAICGSTDTALTPKDFHTNRPGYAWILAAMCRDAFACSRRRQARDAHMEEQYSLTAAGYAAIEALDPAIHATSQPGRYAATSVSKPRTVYALTIEPDSRVACSCPGFTHHMRCKHADQLDRVLAGRSGFLRGAG